VTEKTQKNLVEQTQKLQLLQCPNTQAVLEAAKNEGQDYDIGGS
jgi:hypothetical protein